MTKTKNIALALLLAGMLAAGTAGAALAVKTGSASALDTGSTVTYPFDSEMMNYAATYTASPEQNPKQPMTGGTGDTFEYFEIRFDGGKKDLSSATYVAIQIRLDKGDPGITVGLVENSGSGRLGTLSAQKSVFLETEAGVITEKKTGGNFVNIGSGFNGTIFLPMASLESMWGGSIDKTNMTAVYFEAHAYFNYGYGFTVGEIGYYTGEPADGAPMTKIVSLENGPRTRDGYHVSGWKDANFTLPNTKPRPKPLVFDYPFRTDDEKEYYTATWTGFTVDNTKENMQEVKVKFDTETVDFSQATYLLIQVKIAGTPGIQYILNEGTKSLSPKNGEPFYFYPDNGTQAESPDGYDVANAHITFGNSNMGALVIPMTTLSGSADKTKIDSISFKTNAQYNGNFDLTIGEIGLYKGTAGSGTFQKLLTLDELKEDKFTVSTQLDENKGRLDFNEGEPPITQLGDASVDFNANKHQASDFAVWDGGGSGTVTMTKDSYGLDAVQITPTGVSAGKDSYMATTISGGGGFSWANKQGLSFWARNDSDTEIHFNVEVDCKKNNVADRFNVEGGHRYYLYDVRTGQTTIYLTKATATMGPICLPVGFEGWVRVPFSAYHKADWSANGFPVAEFMKEGTIVSYLAVTVQAQEFANKTFSVNLFGAYATVPSFASALVQSDNTIDKLMGLDQLELQDPIGAAASAIAHQKVDMIVSKEEK